MSSEHGAPWFVVLPKSRAKDTELAAHACPRATHKVVVGPANVPWIFGSWPESQFHEYRSNGRVLVALGHINDLGSEFDDIVRNSKDAAEMAARCRDFPGSYYLLVHTGEETLSAGSRSGLKRLFQTEVDGSLVLSSNAAALAQMYNRRIDHSRVAGKLFGRVPGSNSAEVPWARIDTRDPFRVRVERAATFECLRELTLPEVSELREAKDGALAVRAALNWSIRARGRTHEMASSDVSGLDSGTIFAFANQLHPDIIALTMASRDAGDDDVPWARELVDWIGPTASHRIVQPEDLPVFYEDTMPVIDRRWIDYPVPTILDLRRQTAGYPDVASSGSKIHFTGMGGDHLFSALPIHYRLNSGLLRRDRRAARAIFGIRRGTRRAKVPSYAQWLEDAADAFTAGSLSDLRDDWELAPRDVPWITLKAYAAAAERVQTDSAEPPQDPVRSFEKSLVWSGTEALLPLEHATAEIGMELASPFFDDNVIDAAHSVAIADRISLTEYKPLLSTVASAYIPEKIRRRNTKGTAILDEYLGVTENRVKLRSLFNDSLLGQAGFIDETVLQDLIDNPSDPRMSLADFDQTLAIEVWLRLQEGGGVA